MQLPFKHIRSYFTRRINQFCIPVLVLFPLLIQGQISYSSYLKEEDPGLKADKAYELFHYYIRHDLDSIKVLSIDLLLSSEKSYGLTVEMANRMLGAYLIRTGKPKEGINLLKKSANYFEKKEDYLNASEIFNDIGNGFLVQAEFDEAIMAYNSSLELGKHSPDPTSAFNGELGKAKALLQSGDSLKAIDLLAHYRDRSLELEKFEAASDATALLANIYLAKGLTTEGAELMKKAVRYSLSSDSEIHRSHAYTNLAICYFELDEKDSALQYFEKALDLRKKLNNVKAIIEAYYNLGDYYSFTGNVEKATVYYRKSIEVAEKNDMLRDEWDALLALTSMLKKDGAGNVGLDSLYERKEELDRLINKRNGINDSIIEYAISLTGAAGKIEEEELNEADYSLISLIALLIMVTITVIIVRKKS